MAGEAGKPSRGKGSNGKGFGQKTANDRSGQGKAKNRRTAEKDAPQRAQKEINTQKMSGDLIEEGK